MLKFSVIFDFYSTSLLVEQQEGCMASNKPAAVTLSGPGVKPETCAS